MLRAYAEEIAAVPRGDFALEEVHLRRADEAGDERRRRVAVELHRRADLLDVTLVQHHDLVGHGHRLDLVVGDVDHRRADLAVQVGELQPHLRPERGVEVRQGLVEQEDLGVAHDRPPDGDPLALAAGQRLGLAVEQLLELQHRGRPCRRAAAISAFGRRARLRLKPMFSPTVICG